MKKNMLLSDFNYIADLIRNHVELTVEERALWEQCLKQIETSIDKPRDTKAIVPKRYKPNVFPEEFKENIINRIKRLFTK